MKRTIGYSFHPCAQSLFHLPLESVFACPLERMEGPRACDANDP